MTVKPREFFCASSGAFYTFPYFLAFLLKRFLILSSRISFEVRLFRKYAGGTLRDTSSRAFRFRILTMLKDKQDEAQRRAQRDALISMIFSTIVHDLNKSCDYAYILIGRIWGLGERQIQKILKHADESALGADDFAEFVVILQQILKKRRNE